MPIPVLGCARVGHELGDLPDILLAAAVFRCPDDVDLEGERRNRPAGEAPSGWIRRGSQLMSGADEIASASLQRAPGPEHDHI